MTAIWLWLHGWRRLRGYAIWNHAGRGYQAVRLNSGSWMMFVPNDPMDERGWTIYDNVRDLTALRESAK